MATSAKASFDFKIILDDDEAIVRIVFKDKPPSSSSSSSVTPTTSKTAFKRLSDLLKTDFSTKKYAVISIPYLGGFDENFDTLSDELFEKLQHKYVGFAEELAFADMAIGLVNAGFVYSGSDIGSDGGAGAGGVGWFALELSEHPPAVKLLIVDKKEEIIAASLGDRRVWRNSRNRRPQPPLSRYASATFDSSSLKELRQKAVFSSIETEVSGFAAWSDKKDAFEIQNNALSAGTSSNADTVMFYVEFHTHPIYALLGGTNEIINPPSQGDLSTMMFTYIDGSALSLVVTPNGIFSVWVETALQKALCYGGYPDTRPPSSSKASTVASILWNLVKDVSEMYGNEYGTGILADDTICNSPDRRDCAAAGGAGKAPLWCFYRWSETQEKLANQWADGVAAAFTLSGMWEVLQRRGQSLHLQLLDRDKIDLAAALIAEANGIEDPEDAKVVPLLGSKFTGWNVVDTNDNVSLAPPRVFEHYQPPADRFETADPRLEDNVSVLDLSKIPQELRRRRGGIAKTILSAGKEIAKSSKPSFVLPIDHWKFFHLRDPNTGEFVPSAFASWEVTNYFLENKVTLLKSEFFTDPSLPPDFTLPAEEVSKLNDIYMKWRTTDAKKMTKSWREDADVLLAVEGRCLSRTVLPDRITTLHREIAAARPTRSVVSRARAAIPTSPAVVMRRSKRRQLR